MGKRNAAGFLADTQDVAVVKSWHISLTVGGKKCESPEVPAMNTLAQHGLSVESQASTMRTLQELGLNTSLGCSTMHTLEEWGITRGALYLKPSKNNSRNNYRVVLTSHEAR